MTPSDPSSASHHASHDTHSGRVAQLYDKLFSFEVKNARTAYPIHKKLNFTAQCRTGSQNQSGQPVSDIYHWLGQQLPLAEYQDILDAGCGVGFGCQTLSQYTKGSISGISLSAEEIAQAQRFAREAGLSQLRFARQSFEELTPSGYDCILMIESLKHCSDLCKTMHSVASGLKPGGMVYVVEDVYQQTTELAKHMPTPAPQPDKLHQQLCQDWHLKKLWDIQDLQDSAKEAGLSLAIKWDLTPLMARQSRWWIKLKLALFSMLSGVSDSSVYPVYRGGFILDWLYAEKKMRYQVLELKKQAAG